MLVKIPDFNLLVGRRVESLEDFYGVPKGSTGTIVEIYEPFQAEYKNTGIKSVYVHWDGTTVKDGFAPDEFKFLKLLK